MENYHSNFAFLHGDISKSFFVYGVLSYYFFNDVFFLAYAFSSHPGSQIHDKQSYNKQIHDKEIHNKQIYDKEIHEKQSYNDHNTINSHDMNRRFLILCAILGTSAAVYTFQFCDTDLKTVLSIYQMKMSLAKVKEVPKTTRNDPRSLKIIENTDFVDEFNQKALNGPGNVVLVTGTNGNIVDIFFLSLFFS